MLELLSCCISYWKTLGVLFITYLVYRRRVQPMPQSEPPLPSEAESTREPSDTAANSSRRPPAPSPVDSTHPASGVSDGATLPHESSSATTAPAEDASDSGIGAIIDLFAHRKPKHALQGLSDGLRNAATGVTLGLAGVVAGTYAGAKEDGAAGFAKGFGTGLAGLVGLTGYGAYAGVRQIVRGVGSTPSALSEVTKGEAYWDSSTQSWVRVDLHRNLDSLPPTDDDLLEKARQEYAKAEKDGTLPPLPMAMPPSEGAESAAPGAADADGTTPGQDEATAQGKVVNFYAFLGVPATASPSEIRRAYTRKALEMHPDKNPDDPNATIAFQELNRIYNVLSHEDTRATYDRYGTVDAANVPEMTINPMKDILGAPFLEPLVGCLSFFRVFDDRVLFTVDVQRELSARRCLRLAKNLTLWLDNGAAGLASAQLVIRDAVSTVLGPVFVSYVAEQYHLASRQHLHDNGWVREMDSWVSSWAMSASSLWHWTSMGVHTARRAFVDKDIGEDDVLRVLAVANERDVRRTVMRACRLVLFDVSVSAEQRMERANRLEELSVMAIEEVTREMEARDNAAAIKAKESGAATSSNDEKAPAATEK